MKKKSLYDIAMERKQNNIIENDKVIIVRKKSIFSTILEIIGKIFKIVLYFILLILLTIGATVLLNSQTREIFIDIIKKMC